MLIFQELDAPRGGYVLLLLKSLCCILSPSTHNTSYLLFNPYCTALAKITLLIPEICNASNGNCAEAMFNIIGLGIDDKNAQVYQSALILLDECILQLEFIEGINITPLLSRIIPNLLSKLADSKQKIVESAELALLSLASSSCIDNASIVNAVTKRVKSKESKGGRTVKARLHFLEHLVAEESHFGDGVAWKRLVEFTTGAKALEHKDGGVRGAAKSLIVALMVVSRQDHLVDFYFSTQKLTSCHRFTERIFWSLWMAIKCRQGSKPSFAAAMMRFPVSVCRDQARRGSMILPP